MKLECPDFMKLQINQVLLLPIDLGCLNDKLVQQLSTKFTGAEVEKIKDRDDKLKSKLY